jgi:hypothetical protein
MRGVLVFFLWAIMLGAALQHAWGVVLIYATIYAAVKLWPIVRGSFNA